MSPYRHDSRHRDLNELHCNQLIEGVISSIPERLAIIMPIPQLEGKSLLFGTTASCGLGFMLFGRYNDSNMGMPI